VALKAVTEDNTFLTSTLKAYCDNCHNRRFSSVGIDGYCSCIETIVQGYRNGCCECWLNSEGGGVTLLSDGSDRDQGSLYKHKHLLFIYKAVWKLWRGHTLWRVVTVILYQWILEKRRWGERKEKINKSIWDCYMRTRGTK